MCFRPNEIYRTNVETDCCPTCGMPVEHEPGVTAGQCPYCGDWIPEAPDDFFSDDKRQPDRIL